MYTIEKKWHLSMQNYGIFISKEKYWPIVRISNMPERNPDKGFAIKKTKSEKT